MATLKNTKIVGSNALQLPSGSTATRPTLTSGDRAIRYNTDLDGNSRVIGMETWNGTTWSSVGGGVAQVEPNYTIQSFTNVGSATFNVPVGINIVHVLVVAGGGAGGTLGGGGGAGGYVEIFDYPVIPGGTVPVVVGAGGTAYGGYLNPGGVSNNSGNPSTFGTITAVGGGAGAAHHGDNRFAGSPIPSTGPAWGQPGGSGGGASYAGTTPNGSAQNTPWGYQGYPGGFAPGSPPHSGGGGGGAGSAGCPTGPGYGRGGTGGQGKSSWITGQQTWYAGGGGGGGHGPQSSGGFGGLGGGGSGSGNTIAEDGRWNTYKQPGYAPPSPGAKNTGGGGGGGGHTGGTPYGSGGNGGPGIVIVRY